MPFGSAGPPKPGERRGGRQKGTPNKSTAEIRELAQQYCPRAIRKAAHLMEKAQSESTQLEAVKFLVERGYGKAPQPQQHSGSVGTYDVTRLAGLSLPELKALEGILIRLSADAPSLIGGPSGDSET